jgi:hypothetical protein
MNGTLTAFRLISPKRKKAGREPSKKNRITRAARLDAKSLNFASQKQTGWLFASETSSKRYGRMVQLDKAKSFERRLCGHPFFRHAGRSEPFKLENSSSIMEPCSAVA